MSAAALALTVAAGPVFSAGRTLRGELAKRMEEAIGSGGNRPFCLVLERDGRAAAGAFAPFRGLEKGRSAGNSSPDACGETARRAELLALGALARLCAERFGLEQTLITITLPALKGETASRLVAARRFALRPGKECQILQGAAREGRWAIAEADMSALAAASSPLKKLTGEELRELAVRTACDMAGKSLSVGNMKEAEQLYEEAFRISGGTLESEACIALARVQAANGRRAAALKLLKALCENRAETLTEDQKNRLGILKRRIEEAQKALR